MMEDLVSRVGKALRQMQIAGVVVGTQTKKRGEKLWRTA